MVARGLQRFRGKVALVTGSTEGIGLATVRRLGEEGATVVVSSRKSENVDRAVTELKAAGINAVGVVCHVGKEEDRMKLFEKVRSEFGKLDVLVLNAAVSPHYGPVLSTSEKAWDKTFEINVKAAFLCVRDLLPVMGEGGSIAFISSITGYQGAPEIGAYSVTKTALLGLCRVLARELAPRKIRVNSVAPGIIQTKFSTAIMDKGVENGVLLERFGTVDEAAAAVAFVVSDDASYMTGENLVIAGGTHSRL